jgi:pimeloyl-ACP methyl ester carboxylesterase
VEQGSRKRRARLGARSPAASGSGWWDSNPRRGSPKDPALAAELHPEPRQASLAPCDSLASLWRRSARCSHGFDAISQGPDLPVYLFTGRHDWSTPWPLVEEWAAALEAAHGELGWLEAAGQVAPIEAPEELQRRLVAKLTPLAPR